MEKKKKELKALGGAKELMRLINELKVNKSKINSILRMPQIIEWLDVLHKKMESEK